MNFKKLIKLSHWAIQITSALSAILLLSSFVFAFDAEKGYFEDGFLPVAFIALYTIGIVISVASALACGKSRIIKAQSSPDRSQTTFALAGTLAVLLGSLNVALNKTANETVVLLTGIGICALGAYLLLFSVKNGRQFSVLKLICLFAAVLLPVGIILGNNSNYHYSINSVQNTLCAIFGICFLIYILYEGKSLAEGSHSKLHLPSMLLTFHTGISISAAYILAYLFGEVREEARFYQMFLVLAVSIAVKLQLDQFVKEADARTAEEWSAAETKPETEPTAEVDEETVAEIDAESDGAEAATEFNAESYDVEATAGFDAESYDAEAIAEFDAEAQASTEQDETISENNDDNDNNDDIVEFQEQPQEDLESSDETEKETDE